MTINEGLLENYNSFLKKICKKQTYYDNSISYEELQSEVVYRILSNKNANFKGNSNDFKGWITVITRNVYLNIKNKASNKYTIYHNTILDITEPTYLHIEEEINSKNLNESVDHIVNNIFSDREKRIYTYYISGFKLSEIANMENIPLNTVKTIIHYFKKKIINKIDHKEYV